MEDDVKGRVIEDADSPIMAVSFELPDGQAYDDAVSIGLTRAQALITLVVLTNEVKTMRHHVTQAMRDSFTDPDARVMVPRLMESCDSMAEAAQAIAKVVMPQTFANIERESAEDKAMVAELLDGLRAVIDEVVAKHKATDPAPSES